MKCINPTRAWLCGKIKCKNDGVVSDRLVFSYTEALKYHRMLDKTDESLIHLPCGKCPSCLIRKRKDWVTRLVHEQSLSSESCFITLTYNNDNLPVIPRNILCNNEKPCHAGLRGIDKGRPTLSKVDCQKFLKRLRRHLEYIPIKNGSTRDYRKKIRYFLVGEYGTKTHRPHYHLIIFGWYPSDCVLHERRKNYLINRSPQIEKLWSFGYSTVCESNVGVSKYCARYVTKKLSYLAVDSSLPDDLADGLVEEEFVLSSKGDGGIGYKFCDTYYKDLLRLGYTSYRNNDCINKVPLPNYYYNRLRKHHLDDWLMLRDLRKQYAIEHDVGDDLSDTYRAIDVALNNERYQISKDIL